MQTSLNTIIRCAIAGAAIDVLEVEPPPRAHPLLSRDIPNLLLTPHVAWASETAQSRLAGRIIEIVESHVRAAPRGGPSPMA